MADETLIDEDLLDELSDLTELFKATEALESDAMDEVGLTELFADIDEFESDDLARLLFTALLFAMLLFSTLPLAVLLFPTLLFARLLIEIITALLAERDDIGALIEELATSVFPADTCELFDNCEPLNDDVRILTIEDAGCVDDKAPLELGSPSTPAPPPQAVNILSNEQAHSIFLNNIFFTVSSIVYFQKISLLFQYKCAPFSIYE